MAEIEITPLRHTAVTRTHRGAASELMACAALMNAGYHLYRCESLHAPFDLVAYRDGVCQRVEVKSVTFEGRDHHAPAFSWPSCDEWDLLVVVSAERVFCFDASTTPDEARNIVREYFGFTTLISVPGVARNTAGRCGTLGAYRQHLERNEDPDACEPCAEAKRRQRKRQKRAAR